MGDGEPVGADADPVKNGQGVEDGQNKTVGDFDEQMCWDGAFVPMLASAGVGPQGLLDGADKEVDPQRKQDDYADGCQDGRGGRVGEVGKELVPSREDQRKEDQTPGEGPDPAGEGMSPTPNHP